MAETVAQQMVKLQTEVQNLQTQLQARPTSTKDLSLIALVPKWAGNNKAIPLHEFFETIESTARIANWSQEEMAWIAVLKLTDAARAFYNVNLELHDEKITWAAFKAVFQIDLEMCEQINFTSRSSKWQNSVKMNPHRNLQIDALEFTFIRV